MRFLALAAAALGLAAPGALAQTQQWAVWNPNTAPGLAAGNVVGVGFTLDLNPVGDGTNGGYLISSQNPSSVRFDNTTNYGPNPPATTT